MKTALERAARWVATPAGLATLFAAGFVLRVVLGLGGGFPNDIAIFQGWAQRLAEVGPGEFYSPDVFADYPPGYLYVLWVSGELAQMFGDGTLPVFFVKLPGMLADVGLAYVVMRLATVVAGAAGRDRPWVRPVAAAAILFNPPIVFLSAVWGQVDTVAALYALGGLLLLVKPGRTLRSEAGGAALVALAFATKPQTAFLLPIAVLVFVVRHVRGNKADPAEMWLRLGVPALTFLVTWIALAVPFGMGVGRLISFYADAGSTYPYTSVWAFNFWGVMGFWRADTGPDAFKLLGSSAVTVGMVAFCAAVSYVSVRAYRELVARGREAEIVLAGGAAVVCLSFALLTRIHERYLFLGLACLAPLVVYPRVRAAFVALSGLYMLNLWYPWVFYVEQAPNRTTLNIGWLFDLVYGSAQDSGQKKLLSLVTTIVCVVVAVRIWDMWKRRAPSPEWKLGLHPIGRRGAALAGVVFLVVVPTRLVGLSSPQEMYFDEIYHARTAGEYLQGRDAYEFTHPPLGKELMALSVKAFGRWTAGTAGDPPPGLGAGPVASDGTTAVWATPAPAGDGGVLWTATPAEGCTFDSASEGTPLSLTPSAVALAPGGAYVAGDSGGRTFVARYTGGAEQWRVRVDAPVVEMAGAGEQVFAIDERTQLWRVDATGATALAQGAAGVTAEPAVVSDASYGGVWVAFPDQRIVSAYSSQGALESSPQTQEGADAVVAVPEADRIVAFDEDSGLLETIDTGARVYERSLDTDGRSFAATPSQGIVYVFDGTDVDVVEPRALAFIGETSLEFEPDAFVPVTASGELAAVGDGGVACIAGNNFFTWRLPGALLGALVPALVFLLALRCSGNVLVAALAAAFMALDGLAFAMSRIATLDSQVTAQITASWLAAASVYFHAHALAQSDRRGSRRLGLVWLGATGLFLGLAVATKWVGVFSLLLLAAVMLLDVIVRRDKGVGVLFPNLGLGLAGVLACVVAAPVAIYLLSYMPFMSLGNSIGDVVTEQKDMFDYHRNLTAGHPYSSPWHGWPLGHKAVAMWTGTSGFETGAITAIANPVVLVGGLLALGYAAMVAWRGRVLALGILVVAALAQYLPWTIIGRAAFLYHYLPVVPFLAIGLAWALLGRGSSRLARYEAGFVLAAAIVVFAITLPELDGWFVSPETHQRLHDLLGWMF